MKKIWVHKAASFKEAAVFDRRYYLKMSAQERLENMEFLRSIYTKLKKGIRYGSAARLRRVIRVIS